MKSLEPFSIIKITECYKQGVCIVIVDFEVMDERPGFLLINKETKMVEYMTKEFIMNIAKEKGGLHSDGRPNEKSDYFSEKTPVTVRVRRNRKK